MNSRNAILPCLAFVLLAIAAPSPCVRGDSLCPDTAKLKTPNKIPLAVQAFSLQDVRLLDGPFKHAMELDKQYLLSLDVDSLLHSFRLNSGLPSTAKPLGGWEGANHDIRGHFLGHYLSACAMMYASTGDKRLKEKGDAAVAGLAACQAKVGNGYVSAFPEAWFDNLEAVKPRNVCYYFLHKTLAGLLDMVEYCDNQQALDVCKKLADWIIARNAKLSDEQVQKMLGTEHGGINEVLANLYAVTGEEKYLKIAQRLNHAAVLGPASKEQDKLTGLHANTQIPKFVGAARQYELTGDEGLKTTASFFWGTVVKERSYVIGGDSDNEHFTPKEELSEALGPNTTETCNTYNMLKLTRHLFCWEPRAEYADYYERALYNHILASQNPDDGMMCYYVPLRSGMNRAGILGYCTPLDSFWCCTGTGTENHAKYGDSIYFHDGDKTLYVNLFVASELDWKAKGVKLRQETKYPNEANTRLVFACQQPTELTLRVRHPWWATAGFEIRVNGQPQSTESAPGSYAVVSRTWTNGDTLDVSMPFTLRTEGFRDNPRRFAFMYGPLVLCAAVDAKLGPEGGLKKPYPGVVAEEGNGLGSLKSVDGRPNTFTGPADVFRLSDKRGDSGVAFEPFHKMHQGRRYVVYWDAYTPAQWAAVEAERQAELAREKARAARTVDAVAPGDEPNEREHHLQGDRTAAGDFGGHKWRHATDGGWFSWDLKTLADKPQELQVTYWGSDTGRQFDVLIDGVKIARQKLNNNRPGVLYDEVYEIPKELTAGKDKVVVRFQAQPGGTAGGVFGCRVLRKN